MIEYVTENTEQQHLPSSGSNADIHDRTDASEEEENQPQEPSQLTEQAAESQEEHNENEANSEAEGDQSAYPEGEVDEDAGNDLATTGEVDSYADDNTTEGTEEGTTEQIIPPPAEETVPEDGATSTHENDPSEYAEEHEEYEFYEEEASQPGELAVLPENQDDGKLSCINFSRLPALITHISQSTSLVSTKRTRTLLTKATPTQMRVSRSVCSLITPHLTVGT